MYKNKYKGATKGSGNYGGHGKGKAGMITMMMKMMHGKIFMKNFGWMVFFSKNIAPKVNCPVIAEETRKNIKSTFKTCFLKKTGVDMQQQKINTKQVIEKIRQYKGDERNITAVINAIEQCSGNSITQEDLSICVFRRVLGGCFMKAGFNRMKNYQGKHTWRKGFNPRERGDDDDDDDDKEDDDGDYDGHKYYDNEDEKETENDRGGVQNYQKEKNYGRNFKGMFSMKPKMCAPCYNLQSSEELKNVAMECLEYGAPNYVGKIMSCMKPNVDKVKDTWSLKMKKEKQGWIYMFKSYGPGNFYFGTQEKLEMQKCLFERLGLGTPDNVSGDGYKNMINTYMTGTDKELLITNVIECSQSPDSTKVDFEQFSKCVLQKIDAHCEATA